MKCFKAGDKVYCPSISSKIFKLYPTTSNSYPVKLKGTDHTFTSLGKGFLGTRIQSIYLATEENKAALELLHGIAFESIPKTVTLTFEMPLPFTPEVGDEYFYLDPTNDKGVERAWNTEHSLDLRIARFGVWRTEKEAQQVANMFLTLEKVI